MKFLIIHGSFGNPKENWFSYVKKELEKEGHEVIVPEFPVEDWDTVTKIGQTFHPTKQTLHNWLKVIDPIIPSLSKERSVCAIGHSLGPLFLLHMAERYNIIFRGAVFVSPFFRKLNNIWQIDSVNESFYKTDFNFNKLQKQFGTSYVLYGDNDPYVGQKEIVEFSKALGSKKICIPHGGHLNRESGYTEFPLVVELSKKLTA